MKYLTVCCLILSTLSSIHSTDLKSLRQEREDILSYGIDSEVTELIGKLKDENDASFNEIALQLFRSTKSMVLKGAIVDLFISTSYWYIDSEIIEILQNYEKSGENLLMTALAYTEKRKLDSATPALKELADSENKRTANRAVEMLGLLSPESDIRFLEKMYEDTDDNDKKISIIKAIGNMKSDTAVDFLISVMNADEGQKSLRWYACEALGKTGDERVLAELEEAMQSDDPVLRTYAVGVLSNFNGEDVYGLAVDALRDSNWTVRVKACEILGIFDLPESFAILEYKALKDPEKPVRLAAIKALAGMNSEETRTTLLDIFCNAKEGQEYRFQALDSLTAFPLAGSLERIMAVVNEEWSKTESKILEYSCKKLASIKDTDLVNFFIRCTAHSWLPIRLHGLTGLKNNATADQKELLENLSSDKEPEIVRKYALDALESLGTAE